MSKKTKVYAKDFSAAGRSTVEKLEDELDRVMARYVHGEFRFDHQKKFLEEYGNGLAFGIAAMRNPYVDREEAVAIAKGEAFERLNEMDVKAQKKLASSHEKMKART